MFVPIAFPLVSSSPQLDPFDPNLIEQEVQAWEKETVPIFLDNDGRLRVYISGIDYQWVTEHRWCHKKVPNGSYYARRAVGLNLNKQRLLTFSMYLHIEIMKRWKPVPPSPAHVLVDHRNGNTLDNTRRNLRWATHVMNARNVYGSYSADLIEG